MIRLIIIAAFLFLLGNIVWVSYQEPKLFYVPLAILLALFFTDATIHHWKSDYMTKTSLMYFTLLSYGWVLKQAMYNPTFNFYHDYIWGGLVTIAFMVVLVIETLKHRKKINDLKDTINKLRK